MLFHPACELRPAAPVMVSIPDVTCSVYASMSSTLLLSCSTLAPAINGTRSTSGCHSRHPRLTYEVFMGLVAATTPHCLIAAVAVVTPLLFSYVPASVGLPPVPSGQQDGSQEEGSSTGCSAGFWQGCAPVLYAAAAAASNAFNCDKASLIFIRYLILIY